MCTPSQLSTVLPIDDGLHVIMCTPSQLSSVRPIDDGQHSIMCTPSQLSTVLPIYDGQHVIMCTPSQFSSVRPIDDGQHSIMCTPLQLSSARPIVDGQHAIMCTPSQLSTVRPIDEYMVNNKIIKYYFLSISLSPTCDTPHRCFATGHLLKAMEFSIFFLIYSFIPFIYYSFVRNFKNVLYLSRSPTSLPFIC